MMRKTKPKGMVQTDVIFEGTCMLLVYRTRANRGRFSEWNVKEKYDPCTEPRPNKNKTAGKGTFAGSCLFIKLPYVLNSTDEVADKMKEMIQDKVSIKEIIPSNKKEVALHFNDTEGATKAIQVMKDLMLDNAPVIRILWD